MSDTQSSIKVLVADDHQLMIDGIKTVLQDVPEIQITEEANNGLEVLSRVKHNPVDVVLLDINMPQMDGLDCCRILTKTYPEIKVVVLSQFSEKRFVKRMIKYGASGYVLKDTSKDELITAIKKVHGGGTYFSDKLSISLLQNEISGSGYDPLFPKLTSREKEVLKFICDEYSSQEIAERFNLSFHTVETHRANLMVKAGVKNSAGLARWAVENDLLI
jgi:DNA-binding NarL/FixJ family response regulator